MLLPFSTLLPTLCTGALLPSKPLNYDPPSFSSLPEASRLQAPELQTLLLNVFPFVVSIRHFPLFLGSQVMDPNAPPCRLNASAATFVPSKIGVMTLLNPLSPGSSLHPKPSTAQGPKSTALRKPTRRPPRYYNRSFNANMRLPQAALQGNSNGALASGTYDPFVTPSNPLVPEIGRAHV